MGVEEVKRPEHEVDHLHLVARLRMCGGRGVGEVHGDLTGGLPNVQNTKTGSLVLYSILLRKRSNLYPVATCEFLSCCY
jgi:hypothetical protein